MIIGNVSFASFPVENDNVTNVVTTCDNIIMKNGDEISSKILEITPDQIKYKKCTNLDGPLFTINKSDVLFIRYADGTKDIVNVDKQSQSASVYNSSENGGGTASVLSFISSLLAWVILGIPLSIAAIIFGIIGMRSEKLKGLAILGFLLGVVELFIMIIALSNS